MLEMPRRWIDIVLVSTISTLLMDTQFGIGRRRKQLCMAIRRQSVIGHQ